jgi:hypothetical protein
MLNSKLLFKLGQFPNKVCVRQYDLPSQLSPAIAAGAKGRGVALIKNGAVGSQRLSARGAAAPPENFEFRIQVVSYFESYRGRSTKSHEPNTNNLVTFRMISWIVCPEPRYEPRRN